MALDSAKLREMQPTDLDKEENALRAELWKLRLQRATAALPDPHKVRRVRRDLARVLTARRVRELAAERGKGR